MIIERIINAVKTTLWFIADTIYSIRFSLDIFWKGMLAIFLALGIIMVVIMLLNFFVNKFEKAIKEKKQKNS